MLSPGGVLTLDPQPATRSTSDTASTASDARTKIYLVVLRTPVATSVAPWGLVNPACVFDRKNFLGREGIREGGVHDFYYAA
jgi:hypothetical protein